MASIFSRIIAGELQARFVWQDEDCVAFLSNRPLRPGHTLVVPREEIDHWLDVGGRLWSHLTATAQAIGRAQMAGLKPARVGVMVAGLEVPHVHIHVVPIRSVHDLDFDNQDPDPSDEMMDSAAGTIRTELEKLGYSEVSR